MDPNAIEGAEQSVDKILQALDQQVWNADRTLENFKILLDRMDAPAREEALDYIFGLLVNRIRGRSAADQTALSKQQRYFGVVFKVLFEYGRVETTLCKIIGFLDADSSHVSNNWRECVSSVIVGAVNLYSDSLSQGTLDVLKQHVALFSVRGSDFSRLMPAFLAYVAELNRAIGNAEFARFERRLRTPQPPVAPVAAPHDRSEFSELEARVSEALVHAGDCLRGEGTFDPKKAADLLRSCIDEAHRQIVSRVAAILQRPYTGGERDGKRREYLRCVHFISDAEDKFFSAIYTLLSEEASHKLIAPRETVLLVEQVVRGYLLLLDRRLSDFRPPAPEAKP